ncbi:MAG: HlyD family efflux transporter periplasmic adaptor subunit [Bacteroidales bacterium]|nr:HlyD family efflux transporter periplasmic adaptor subunit [Bacteroidales bacterium]
MKTLKGLLIFALLLQYACREKADQADAYGNFEATEVIVSSETSGKIRQFNFKEGMPVERDDLIALVDTAVFHLQKEELNAGIRSISTKVSSINAQNEIISQQISNLKTDLARIENMLRNDAATQKQYDDLKGQMAVLEKQIAANNTQKTSVAAELEVYRSKKATLNEQISRCFIRSPIKGTLIEKYAEEGEVTVAGKPVAKVADLSVIKLRAYVSGSIISSLKIGEQCTVRTDDGKKGYKTFSGTISHIAEKAEFTPKIIQTKEERVLLVYAVLIDVLNDGSLKAGMPGEVIFTK